MLFVRKIVVIGIIFWGGAVIASDISEVIEETAHRVGRRGVFSSKSDFYPVSNLGSFASIYERGTQKSIRTLLSYVDFSNREYADAALHQLNKFLKTSPNKILYPLIKKEKLISLREEVGNVVIKQLQKNKNFNNYSLCTKVLATWGTKKAYDILEEQLLIVSGYDLYSVLESLLEFSTKSFSSWIEEATVKKIIGIGESSSDNAFKNVVDRFLEKIGRPPHFQLSKKFLEKDGANISIFLKKKEDGSTVKFIVGGIFIKNGQHKKDVSRYSQMQWAAKDFFDNFYKTITLGELETINILKTKSTSFEAMENDFFIARESLLYDVRNIDISFWEGENLSKLLKTKGVSHIVTVDVNLCLWCQQIKGTLFVKDFEEGVIKKKKVYIYSDRIVMDDSSPHYTTYDKSNLDTPSRGTYQEEVNKICEELSKKLGEFVLKAL